MWKGFLVWMLLILVGCEANVEKVEVEGKGNQNRIIIQNTSPESVIIHEEDYEIIPFYEPYVEFLEEPDQVKRKEIFTERVVKPFSTSLFGNEYTLQNDPLYVAPRNVDKLRKTIEQLDKEHDEISILIKDALKDSSLKLSGGSTKIYLQPYHADYSSKEMTGVAGFAYGSGGGIVLQIDPENYTEESIKQTIAHEYHHIVYMKDSDWLSRSHNLLDKVIMEGKADTFTKIVYPDYASPWIERLDENAQDKVWQFIQENKTSIDDGNRLLLHHGRASMGIPKWSNYKIGYLIMEDFLENNPDVTIAEWTVMRADEILELSGFDEY
ncbi:DUF2268 domain-containing protein [Sutcliffiella horikoshii]|uniref:DUF2268 domain-containing protein n=1 Tax=Sutcliffiella horikoshii TaxID=79883 RepID=UPI002041C177|nr:DUF2268 domain-containing putative Zn-dependent protease [Sutcliffiella horikoshii]MCM3619932.1 DUF2268 domain-containing protein [Sutcliffiella horikoshii]